MSIEKFLATLPIMGKGMLGIFIVMAVIYLVILILIRATKNEKRGAE